MAGRAKKLRIVDGIQAATGAISDAIETGHQPAGSDIRSIDQSPLPRSRMTLIWTALALLHVLPNASVTPLDGLDYSPSFPVPGRFRYGTHEALTLSEWFYEHFIDSAVYLAGALRWIAISTKS